MAPSLPPHAPTAALLAALMALGCGDEAAPTGPEATRPGARTEPAADRTAAAEPGQGLPDEARERGLAHTNRSGELAKATILEANGAGVAVLDLGGDDDLDIVFAQGLDGLGRLLTGPGADLEVFVNDGTGHFERGSAPGLSGWWTGLAAGDVDGDGLDDLVAGGFGSVRVLLQDPSGRLVPGAELVPEGAGRLTVGEPREPGLPPDWTSSLALFDADRDGLLDLFVGGYLELDPVDPPLGELGEGALAVPCRWKGYPVYCGPHGLVPQRDRLLLGRGDGTFVDASERLAGAVPGFTLAVGTFDADADGDTDVYVANDSVANNLWINDGEGRFVDMGLAAGVALSMDGAAEAGMGVAFGDVDRDGQLDLAVTNFSGEPNELFLSSDVGFTNRTHRFGLFGESRALLSWSVHLVDLDGDTWLELFTANGHVYPQADLEGTGTRYGQRDTLWRLGPQLGAVPFVPRTPRSALAPEVGTRGTALGDFDGDGAPDLVLDRIDGPAALAMNRMDPGARWLAVRCLGPAAPAGPARPRTPQDGRGARVVVVPETDGEPFALVSEVQTAVGYQSSSTPWLHFGLAGAERYASIEVRWPSGRVERLGPGDSEQRLWIREGEGVVRAEALP